MDSEDKTIWLLRHAESEANRDCIIQGHFDTELTDKGELQALQTAIHFHNHKDKLKIQNLFSSDLKRAISTAKPIAKKLGLKILIEKHLREAHFGKWEGIPAKEISQDDKEIYKKWKNSKAWRPEWCESFEELQKRALKKLTEISKLKGNSLVVTHGGLIHSILAHYLGSSDNITLKNCSISKLKINNSQINIEEVNIVASNLLKTELNNI
ncbi:MAG: histidine phosphatase family protein [Candidatus Caenarcaniphilales bacterium]|nr:histidine phosphatase family protein [Candidatus Caenarcaniphilales bacterium]